MTGDFPCRLDTAPIVRCVQIMRRWAMPGTARLGRALLLMGLSAVVGHAAERVTPVAVTLSSGSAYPSPEQADKYAAHRAIDGDPETFCCLLDDTLAGDNESTMPPRAAAPVTGHMVFDLGGKAKVVGAVLTSRRDGGPYNPKLVDFFHFADDDPGNNRVPDDLDGDADLRPLAVGQAVAPLRAGESATFHWPAVTARYIGLRVNASYESGGHHFNFQLGEVEFLLELQPGEIPAGVPLPLVYEKRPTLIETLLNSRGRCQRWLGSLRQAGQPLSPAVARRLDGLWARIRQDFPAAEHPLLDYVLQDWFAADGWLTHGEDTGLEQALIARAASEADQASGTPPVAISLEHRTPNTAATPGTAGGVLRQQLQELRQAARCADDPAWLRLCTKAAEVVPLVRGLSSLQAAIEHLGTEYPQQFEPAPLVARVTELRQRVLHQAARADPDFRPLAMDLESLQYEALVRRNPLLACGRLLFVKRFTYRTGWYYAEFMQAGRPGGNLCVLSLADGQVRDLLPEWTGAIFDRYDLSFDGRRIVFGCRRTPEQAFRLYEVGADGQGLRQLTFDPPGEAERLASYGLTPGVNELGPWRKHTDDFHPCHLPDGGICFASSRCERGVLCDVSDNLSVNVLYRVDSDGGNLTMLSSGALSESTPAMMNDGRILYTRWEYVDKGVIAAQDLWAMRPDGSASCEVYGGHHEFPPVLIHGQAIPGRQHQFICTATMHHPFAVGPILKIDTSRDIRTLAPIRNLTPDTGLSIEGEPGFPVGECYTHLRNGAWVNDNRGPLFCDPYPLSDKFFLVACNPDQPWNHETAYGLWLIDEFGNRVRIYQSPDISCWQPVALRSRPVPPVLPPVAARGQEDRQAWGQGPREGEISSRTPNSEHRPLNLEPPTTDHRSPITPAATLVLSNVYDGLTGVAPGEIRYLRIWEQVPRPWTAHRFWPDDAALGQNAVISMYAHIYVKVLHGIVPVEADGSAHFAVPADRNIFLQALDQDFMEVQRMRTFVNLRPGESRSCIGCHEPRNHSPSRGVPLALLRAADVPGPQPGETVPRPLDYPTDIQPILDQHCIRCHGGDKTEGGVVLTGELTTYFNRSYETMMAGKWITYIQEFVGPQPRAQKTNVTPLPPKSLGSHASRLIQLLRAGHYDVALSRDQWVRLVTWVDANGPYYGSYFGRRNLKYQGLPDFRPLPVLAATGETVK